MRGGRPRGGTATSGRDAFFKTLNGLVELSRHSRTVRSPSEQLESELEPRKGSGMGTVGANAADRLAAFQGRQP